MARIICTRTDINISLESSCDVAMLHVLELDCYNLESLLVLWLLW